VLAKQADTAARLAKTDLLTDMVGEFPELQGIMGGYYARHDGLSEDIAFAIEDHYKPRFAGDALPRNAVGMVVALADKLETLAGMFGIGNLPSGDKDPFALRRHALGVVRILMEHELKIPLGDLLNAAINEGFARRFSEGVQLQTFTALHGFFVDRLSGYLQEQGFSVQLVSSIQFVASTLLTEVPKRLEAVRTFASLPEAPALAAANKRIGNILKKSEGVGEAVNASMFQEPAEQALFDAMQATVPAADAKFEAGDFTASLQALAALRAPVDAFFDGVMVNADDPALKANRLALLQQLHRAMNRVADLSRLAA
jgi:glycyl-tRNA synthetase beta chain